MTERSNMTYSWDDVVWCYRCGGVVSAPEGHAEPEDTEKCDCRDLGLEPKEQPGETV